MSTAAKRTRENRTITVDFRDEATYFQLLGDGKAFAEFVFAFLLALGFQLLHKATCDGGGCPDAPLALCPCPPGWRHHLADPMHHGQSRLHRPAAFYLALSPDTTRGRARCPLGHSWGPQFGTLCGALSYVPAGPLSSHLCVWPPEPSASADPVWGAAPGVFPGG